MVVSVPRIIKCLSLSDTIDIVDFVGALDISVALVVNALILKLIGLHEKVFPFFAVAINTCPK